MRHTLLALLLALTSSACTAATRDCAWPAWEAFKTHMVSADGRVIDASSPRSITTSEGQSYALFFALVANDRATFARLLRWTHNNLAGGDLGARLPAWLWGRNDKGAWQILDANNASDADLWIAYALLEAGRLWDQPDYTRLAERLLWRSAAESLLWMPDVGLVLLPGRLGFINPTGARINPSYSVPQLFARFAQVDALWAQVDHDTQRALIDAAPQGFVPDWRLRSWQDGWKPDAQIGLLGSYDAIRSYLWIGMMAADAPGRAALQQRLAPMAAKVAALGRVPEKIDTQTGSVSGTPSSGFAAALLPLLAATQQHDALAAQRAHLHQHPADADAYYAQVLTLFGQGWDQGRYRFAANGNLQPAWVRACPP